MPSRAQSAARQLKYRSTTVDLVLSTCRFYVVQRSSFAVARYFSRGWAMGERPDEALTLDALEMAIESRRPLRGSFITPTRV